MLVRSVTALVASLAALFGLHTGHLLTGGRFAQGVELLPPALGAILVAGTSIVVVVASRRSPEIPALRPASLRLLPAMVAACWLLFGTGYLVALRTVLGAEIPATWAVSFLAWSLVTTIAHAALFALLAPMIVNGLLRLPKRRTPSS